MADVLDHFAVCGWNYTIQPVKHELNLPKTVCKSINRLTYTELMVNKNAVFVILDTRLATKIVRFDYFPMSSNSRLACRL